MGASDHIHIQNFKLTVFDNVHEDSMVYIFDPPKGWANPTDCGNYPCTAPQNAVVKFTGTTYTGAVKASFTDTDFQAVGNYKSIMHDTCVKKDKWNAFFCKNTKIGILKFDSLDGDTMDRSVQPVYMKNYDTGLVNKLNNDMDHCWDGVYTCQKRRTRFIAQVQTDKAYVIEYTGTPPGK